jgi:hypothetical protein
MKKLLFIGGAGFIGSNIIRRLQQGDYVIHVCEPVGANTQRLEGLEVQIHHALISDIEDISRIIQDNRGLNGMNVASLELKAPEFVYLPLQNSRCPKAESLVKEGDKVLLGQKIGVRHAAWFDQNIHATVSGVVVGIEKHGYRNGNIVEAIKIKNDFKDELDPSIDEKSDEEIAKLVEATKDVWDLVDVDENIMNMAKAIRDARG